MSIVWSVQILASFGFEIYKNWKIQKIVVAMETVRKISKFFTFVFITQYKLKMGKVSEKSIFSISKPYCEVSDFLRELLLRTSKLYYSRS